MGVLNVTPDSFSDGGAFADPARALAQAEAMIAAGVDVIDIGGESTRPGAAPVDAETEIARVLPMVEALAGAVAVSIDTMKPDVARAAMRAGATMWNDVRALQAEGGVETAAEFGCDVVLMHMQGAPQTMQADPCYADVVAEVIAFLRARIDAATAAGVKHARIYVDPGIGFGKTLAHNLALMRALPRIAAETGAPILFGASRKRFVKAIDPSAEDPLDRIGGSIAVALHAARAGAAVVRVHDVRQTRQALLVQQAIEGAA
jgi:dihydropteroate synthase